MKEFKTQYKGLFSAEPILKEQADEVWGQLVKKVGEWLFDEFRDVRCNRANIIRSWLFLGGYWDSFLPETTAEVQVLYAGKEAPAPPKYWVFRLEQRDARHRERVWRTDVGITVAETDSPRFDIAVTHSYFVLSTHVGRENAPPEMTIPGIVRHILEGETYKITLGGIRLRYNAKRLQTGDGRDFVQLLKNPQRIFPIILMRPDENNRFAIDPDHLASLVAGNSIVFCFQGDGADQEMKHFIGFNHSIFRCPRHAVRVFQPRVNFENPEDYARHRFFMLKDADSNALFEVEKMIFRGVQRRQTLPFRDFVNFREELFRKEKEYRLRVLRESRQAENDAEYIQLLEEELAELTGRTSKMTQTLENQAEELLFSELKILELQKQNKQLEFERKQLEQLQADSNRQISQLERRQHGIRHFDKLPANLTEVLEKVAQIHAARLVVLPEATASAQKASFDNVPLAWAALWQIAETLWSLYFLENANTSAILHEFQRRTGFDMSLGESKMTRVNNELMQQRTRKYRGQDIEVISHVKVDKGGKYLRIHYYPDREHRVLVIGHFGDHLDIFSSLHRH